MAIKFAENSRRSNYRVAVVVSKKVSKSAVRRNRIRRRLYEAIRLNSPHITEAFDIVITVFHEQIADIPATELSQMVRAQLKQAKITTNSTPGRAKIDKEGE